MSPSYTPQSQVARGLLLLGLAGVILFLACAGPLMAQSGDLRSRFEVAVLKPVTTYTRGNYEPVITPKRITYPRVTLTELLILAYGVDWNLIEMPRNGPRLVFRFEAIVPDGTPRERIPGMIQTLLEERLGLKAHLEKREMPVYAVEIAKSGLKMQPAESGAAYSSMVTPTERRFSGVMPLNSLLAQLQPYLDRPIVNMTGLNGKYDIKLVWQVEVEPGVIATGEMKQAIEALRNNPTLLFSAMRTQLGVQVKATKSPMEMLVVDHVDSAPSEQ